MNAKSKLYLFHRLRGEQHAVADLQLLKSKYPTCKRIDRFSRNPKGYAFDILYALLDVATEEEITQNRQPEEKPLIEPLKVDGSSDTLTGDAGSSDTLTGDDGSSDTLTGDDGSSDTLTGDDGSSGALTDDEPEPQKDMEDSSKKK